MFGYIYLHKYTCIHIGTVEKALQEQNWGITGKPNAVVKL